MYTIFFIDYSKKALEKYFDLILIIFSRHKKVPNIFYKI